MADRSWPSGRLPRNPTFSPAELVKVRSNRSAPTLAKESSICSAGPPARVSVSGDGGICLSQMLGNGIVAEAKAISVAVARVAICQVLPASGRRHSVLFAIFVDDDQELLV